MSYDLMVFEVANAPTSKKEFMTWYSRQVEWSEDHDYESIEVSSPALRNWFMEMKDIFPPLNGEFAPDDDALDKDPDLEDRMVDLLDRPRSDLCRVCLVTGARGARHHVALGPKAPGGFL